jgi:hypothetical protein
VTGIRSLPERVLYLIESSVVTDFATVSAAGVGIDTPTYYFPSDDLATMDVATGLPNPAKAERARRNPKVGLYVDGKPDEPVVVVAARAAVRDADLQANCVRYLAETGWKAVAFGLEWEEARKAVNYWSRIIIENMPAKIYWWDNAAAMDEPPHVWRAPADTQFPPSDPKPTGEMGKSEWKPRPWREVAADAVKTPWVPRLTVLDEEGYPLPLAVRSYALTDEGFSLVMPKGAPWKLAGVGTLSFGGFQTFVGEAFQDGAAVRFVAERALPQLASTEDNTQVLRPNEETRRKQMARLQHEAARRGQSIPDVPLEAPARTRLAKVREARIAGDAPITGMTVEKGNRAS